MRVEDKNLDRNPSFPFCSKQCKMADLDRWFRGEYGVSQPLDELTPDQLDDLPGSGLPGSGPKS